MKQVSYLVIGKEALAVYEIQGDCCYFSGITLGASTISFAGEIMTLIAEQEGVPIEWFRFFDLQTHRCYETIPSGAYDFDEIMKKPEKWWWKPTPCALDVLALFQEYVGEPDPSAKIWSSEEARRQGYHPYDMRSHNSGVCFKFLRLRLSSQNMFRQLAQTSIQLAVEAEKITGSKIHDALIVVDQSDSEEFLAASQGRRYCVWRRDTTADN